MPADYAHRFDPPLLRASFLARPHRFAVHARLAESDRTVEAHLPDPGRLRELLVPGADLWLQPADAPHRKTAYSARLVRSTDGELVSIDTQLPNRLLREALRKRQLPRYAALEFVRAEASRGRSRFDFLLSDAAGTQHYLEVKSVSLVERGVALFPDAVTERGRRHLQELTELKRAGHGAHVLFLVQRGDATRVRAAEHLDPAFAGAVRDAARAGVDFRAHACRFDANGARWLHELPFDTDA